MAQNYAVVGGTAWLFSRSDLQGAFDYLFVDEAGQKYFEVPNGIADEHATFFHIAATIVMNGVRRGKVQWGECVVVFGQGLLGQLVSRFSALSGARPVVAIDICLPTPSACKVLLNIR